MPRLPDQPLTSYSGKEVYGFTENLKKHVSTGHYTKTSKSQPGGLLASSRKTCTY